MNIREKNHFLILGWNRKGIALLYFLSRLGKKARVVIMTSVFTEIVRKEIRHQARKMENIKCTKQVTEERVRSRSREKRITTTRTVKTITTVEHKTKEIEKIDRDDEEPPEIEKID